MSKDTFAFSSSSLRSLRLEQEYQDWQDARRALAHRRAMTRAPLAPAPRPPPRQQRLQEVRAPPPQARCRDTAVHNTFMFGDMKGVYAVLKDPAMVNALMETVHEEMVWAPEMGETFNSPLVFTSHSPFESADGASGPLVRHVDAELQGQTDLGSASGRRQRTHRMRGGAAVSWSGGERRPRGQDRPP